MLRRSTPTMMPEGPEVRSLTDRIRHRYSGGHWELRSASIISGRYKEGARPAKWDKLQSALPLKVVDVRCKGKFIYFSLDENTSIWSTLGMTGGWTLARHRHTRVSLGLAPVGASAKEEEALHFYDMRNFGTLKVCFDECELHAKITSLGPAWLPLDENCDHMSEDSFVNIALAASKRAPNRPLAVFLMDQTKTAGIGNYILSEILFETRTWPFAKVGDVEPKRWAALYQATTRVMAQSYLAQATESAAEGYRSTSEAQSKSNIGMKHGVQSLEPSGFSLCVYGRKFTSVLANVYAVQQAEGPHKRTVHWVPELQVGCKCSPSAKDSLVQVSPWSRKTVFELKLECRARKLKVSGLKNELVRRLDLWGETSEKH